MGTSNYQFKCGRRGGRGDGLLRNGERGVAVGVGSGLCRVGLFALHRRTIGRRELGSGSPRELDNWDSWFVAPFALAVMAMVIDRIVNQMYSEVLLSVISTVSKNVRDERE